MRIIYRMHLLQRQMMTGKCHIPFEIDLWDKKMLLKGRRKEGVRVTEKGHDSHIATLVAHLCTPE